jgi:hypothetical protein
MITIFFPNSWSYKEINNFRANSFWGEFIWEWHRNYIDIRLTSYNSSILWPHESKRNQ